MENSAPQTPLLHLIGQTCRLHRHGAPSPSDHAPIVGVRAGTFDSPNPKAVVLLHAAPHVLAKRHQPKVRYRRHNVREIVDYDRPLYWLVAGAVTHDPQGRVTLHYTSATTRTYATKEAAIAQIGREWITCTEPRSFYPAKRSLFDLKHNAPCAVTPSCIGAPRRIPAPPPTRKAPKPGKHQWRRAPTPVTLVECAQLLASASLASTQPAKQADHKPHARAVFNTQLADKLANSLTC